MKPLVSIIICTSNRAHDLRQTLAVMKDVKVPHSIPTELLVVDNASSDDTAEAASSYELPHMQVRYVYEPRRGKGYAYNTGMAQAKGDVFLFTDDDVRPGSDWIKGMCQPILSGQAHAVAGGVILAPYLERPWMEPFHRMWLASTESLLQGDPLTMIGANMAFSRSVLEKVPAFDPELGPGALGFGDEVLFSLQLVEAGYKIVPAVDVVVVHHADAARLQRRFLVENAKKQARTHAYIEYHWRHREVTKIRLRYLKARGCLLLKSLANKSGKQREGLSSKEVGPLFTVHFYKQFMAEQKRPHNYEQFGLIKLKGLLY